MGNPLDTQSSLQLLTLVTFSFGSSETRYVNWDEDLTIGGEVFTSLPGIEFLSKELHGGTKDESMTITMRSVSPINAMVLLPSPVVNVLVEQMKLGDESSRRKIFYGRMGEIVENAGGKPGIFRFDILGLKSLIDAPLGLQALTDCNHAFGVSGDENCNYDLTATGRTQTGVLTIIQGSTVEVAGLTPVVDTGDGQGAVLHERLFFRGVISLSGLYISIRDYNGDGLGGEADERLILDYPPPPSWDGETVTVKMGCPRTREACDERGNISQFRGLAIKMPDRNTQFESGD